MNSLDLLATLTAIKADVDARITYDNSDTINQLPDWTWVTKGSHGRGDCTCYAQSYMMECDAAGLTAASHVYRLDDGRWHAVCVVAGYILDCRHQLPVRAE